MEWKDGSAVAYKSISFWLRLITCNNIAGVQTRRNVTWAPDGLKNIDHNYLIKRHSTKVKLSYKGTE